MNIFPNPATHTLSINGIQVGKLIEIFNIHGNRLMSVSDTVNINISHLTKGLYYLKVNGQPPLPFIKN
ncbi:MAG: T9SS type A sorting domain-containing protein [Bacteroidota bacterium]